MDYGSGWFVATEVKGETLRELLLSDKLNNYDECENIINSIYKNWREFRNTLNTSNIRLPNCNYPEQLKRDCFYRILHMEPFGKGFKSKYLFYRQWVIRVLLRRYIVRNNLNLYEKQLSIVHGDWNLNNILINNDAVKVIDFEDTHYGAPEIEALYMYAILWRILRRKCDIDSIFNKICLNAVNDLDIELMNKLLPVFKIAAAYSCTVAFSDFKYSRFSMLEKYKLWRKLYKH